MTQPGQNRIMYWMYFIATIVCCSLLNNENSVRAQGPPPTSAPPSFNDTANWEAAFAVVNDSTTSRTDDKNMTVFDRIFRANALARGNGTSRSDNVFLFEADIQLTAKQLSDLVKSEKSRTKRAVIKKTSRNLWRRNGIAYSFASSISGGARSVITGAVREWENALQCMGKWSYTTPNSRRDQMVFFRGGGCYSLVGRQGGPQKVSIGQGCAHHGTVVHEIGHAMGLWHEQSRPDRDSYVTIVWGNIIKGMQYNFRKKTARDVDSLGILYDYGSVMHYGATAFANRRGAKTIIAKGNPSQTLGQHRGLSGKDRKQVKLLYGCDKTTVKPNPTKGCTDSSSHRSWCAESKKVGICTNALFKSYMKSYCCATCTPPKPKPKPKGCIDKKSTRGCQKWKNAGYCSKTSQYRQFMVANCCRTCSGAPGICADKTKKCLGWKTYCTSHKTYMHENCKKTCGICT